jgi:hypothetical protein
VARTRLRVHAGALVLVAFTISLLSGAGPVSVLAASPVIGGIEIQLPAGNTISGTLKNGDGDPITGFSVMACTPDEDCVADGQTDGSGAFEINGLPPDTYVLSFNPIDASDYLPGWYATGGPVTNVADATPVDASAGDVTGVAIVADAGFSISGTVTGAGAGALANVQVIAQSDADGGVALTDGTGHYSIRGLTDDSYMLMIRVPPSLNFRSGGVAGGSVVEDEFGGDTFPLNGANATGKNVVAPVGLRISGTLTGTGAAGAGVTAFGSADSDQATVAGNGTWSIGGLWPGTYNLVFAQKQTYEFDSLPPLGYYTGGATLSPDVAAAADIHLLASNVSGRNAAIPNGLSLAGSVTGDDGLPVKDAYVLMCGDLGSCASTLTSASGAWKVDFLPSDSYVVQAFDVNHVGGYFGPGGFASDESRAAPVHLTSADVAGIDMVLPAGATFTGHVSGPLNEDVVDAFVFASGTSGIPPAAPGSGETDANGDFTLRGLAEDEYIVHVTLPPFSTYLAGYYDDTSPDGYTPDFGTATTIPVGDAAVGSSFVPIPPKRVVDSRTPPIGVPGIFSSDVPRTFQVAGLTPIPADAVAVTGNVTVVGQTSGGYVSLSPKPTSNPKSSTINVPIGDTRANNFTIPLDALGRLSAVFKGSAGSKANILVDITGYFVNGDIHGTYAAIAPGRILDTRSGLGLKGTLKANVSRTLSVAGAHGIPNDATAITANLTIVGQTRAGFVSITPNPQANPQTSTINFPVGDTRANGLTAQLNGSGDLSIIFKAASGETHAILDVTGYYRNAPSGSLFYPLPPARLVDTRAGVLATELAGPFNANAPRTFEAIGHGGISLAATAITGNLTITGQTAGGYASITPDAVANPATSTINFPLGDTRANGVTVPLNVDGELAIVYKAAAGKKTHMIVDVTGYFR